MEDKDKMIYVKEHYKLITCKNEKGKMETFKSLCNGYWRRKGEKYLKCQ